MTKVSNQPIPTNMQVVAKYVKKGACVVGSFAGSAIFHEDLFANWDARLGFSASLLVGGALTVVSAGLFYKTLEQQPKALEEEKSTNLLDRDDSELDLEDFFESANETKQEEGASLVNKNGLYNLQFFKNLEEEEKLIVEKKSANIESPNPIEDLSYEGIEVIKEYKSFVTDLYKELALYETKPWLEESVLAVADNLCKLAEKISIGLPDYLPGFLERLEKNGINQSFTDALTQEENELYPTAYYFPFVYHMIRSGVCRKGEIGGLKLPGVIAKSTSSPFYEEGTSQYEWRAAYNSYCEKMRMYLDKDSDLYNLLEPDVSLENYAKVNRTSYPEKVTRPFNDQFAFRQ